MALNSKRVRLIAVIILCALFAIVALAWFVIAPTFIENQINQMLVKVEDKTGRHVEIQNVKLISPKSASIRRMIISDIHAPERPGITLDDVEVTLSAIPTSKNFSIQAIHIDELNVNLRITDGSTNFDDVLNKLIGEKQNTVDHDTQKITWKRFITPFPAITVQHVAISMPPLQVHKTLEISAISAANVAYQPSPQNHGFYDIQSQLSVLLDESGTRTTYNADISGSLKNRHEGYIAITQPRSDQGLVPSPMRYANSTVSFKTASLVLPTTFEIDEFHIEESDKTLVHAQKAKARLMTLPPQKVSGVYFKEIELIHPQIHDYIRDDGSAIYKLTLALAHQFAPDWKSAVKETTKEMAIDAAKGALAAGLQAAASGNKDIVEEITLGAMDGLVKHKAKSKDLKDYFFSQRMFITDGQISVEDQRAISMANMTLDQLQLEVGYRSIRKDIDYLISCHVQSPVQTQLQLKGTYDVDAEKTKGSFIIHPLRATDSLHKTQAGLTAQNIENEEGTSILLKLLPTFNFEKTIFEATFDYNADFKMQDFHLHTGLTLKDLQWTYDIISPEPVLLSGSLNFGLHANLAENQFKLENVQIKTYGTDINFAMSLTKAERKTRVRNSKQLKLIEDWKFDVSMQLPQQPMQQLFDAVPHALRTDLDGLSWQGMIGLDFSAKGFLGALSETQHKFNLTTSEDFGVLTWPVARDLMALNNGFTHTVIDPNALVPHEITIPPSIYPVMIQDLPVYIPTMTAEQIRPLYPHWVLFDDLNPWLVQLITTTEDGSFFSHAGFSPLQIKAALEKNVTQQSFRRGASTISMQLIKNLFFERTKTISRKAQEVLYTWLMESIVQIPKQRIMELYFNIIEFGPEIYGIEEAAKYYFGKRSQDLSLKECAFLMSIIPNPRKGAVYRVQTTLDRGIQKMMNFYIQEMYRRKCDPDVILKTREKYARMNKPVPFEPCCPPRDSLQLMIDNGTLSFYVPDPKDTLQYAYLPELYTPDGSPLFERSQTTCGYRGGALDGELDNELIEPANAIFEPFVPSKSTETVL